MSDGSFLTCLRRSSMVVMLSGDFCPNLDIVDSVAFAGRSMTTRLEGVAIGDPLLVAGPCGNPKKFIVTLGIGLNDILLGSLVFSRICMDRFLC